MGEKRKNHQVDLGWETGREEEAAIIKTGWRKEQKTQKLQDARGLLYRCQTTTEGLTYSGL